MGGKPCFLSIAEWEQQSDPKRFFPRRVREIFVDRPPGTPRRLTTALSGLLQDLQPRSDSTHPWFAGAAVSVREGDGKSWSAESAAQLFRKTHGHFKLLCFSARTLSPASLPLITDVIGRRRFLKRVVARRAGPGLAPLRWWNRFGVFIILIVVTTVLLLLDEYLGDLSQVFGWGASELVNVGILGVATAALTVASKKLMEKVTTRPGREGILALRERLEELAAQKSSAVADLVNDLATDLGRGRFPRVLIVDDFERLDLLTRKVLERYLELPLPGSGSEFWLLFEGPSGDRLSLRQLQRRRERDFHGIRLFEQLPLSPEERLELAAAVGNPERATFATVRAICAPDLGTRQSYLELLKSDLLEAPPAPGRYGDLDLLHLLWLNAQCGFATLERRYIVGNFAVKEGLRAELLANSLPGTNHRREEFDRALSRLGKALGGTALLSIESDRGVTRITLHHETGLAFETGRDELKLASSGLGHAYWAIFWFDKLRSHPMQAFWVRKLALHLVASDFGRIDDPGLYERTLVRILEATTYAIRGALRTCVYEPLPELLRRAATRAEEEAVRDRAALRRQLRETFWEAYSVTGSEDALAGYLRLAAADLPAEEAAVESPLATLFVESMPVSGAGRSTLLRTLAALDRHRDREESLRFYSTLRAARFALTLSGAASSARGALLQDALKEAFVSLPDLASGLTERLDALPVHEVSATDLLSLVLALWCLPFPLEGEVGMRSLLELARPAEAGGVLPLRSLDRLVSLAETATLLSEELRGEVSESAGTDLVRIALARELCCVVLATGALAARSLSRLRNWQPPPQITERWLETVRMAATPFELDSGRLVDFDALRSRHFRQQIDRLLEQSSFLWRQFGLNALSLFAQIRRVELLAACEVGTSATWQRSAPLRDALQEAAPGVEHASLHGFLNLARLFHDASELHSDFFLQASRVVVEGEFGARLKSDISWMAIDAAHHLNVDLGRYLDFLLLAKYPDERSPLSEQLDRLADDEVEGQALRLLNAGLSAENEQTYPTLRRVISECLDHERWPPEPAEKVRSLLSYFDFKQEMAAQELPETAAVLADWTGRREAWTYAGVLSGLVGSGRSEPELIEEALAVLAAASPDASFNSYFFLALALARELLQMGRELPPDEQPTLYLLQSIEKWEPESSADTNAAAYRLLHRICGDDSQRYLEKAEYWGVVKLQHDEASKLLSYLEQGRFAAIFLYYFELLSGWGLPTELEAGTLIERLRSGADERRRWIGDWKRRGERLPTPFIDQTAAAGVSSDFVLLGRFLFQPPILEDSAYDPDRKLFNEAARQAASELFRKSGLLPQLPPSIRDLVLAYSRRFERYTVPSEASAG